MIRKGTGGEDGYSAFSQRDPQSGATQTTGLDDLLRERGVERVVIVGLATNYCVNETGLDALRKGLATTVLTDGIRAVDLEAGDGDRAHEQLVHAGADLKGT